MSEWQGRAGFQVGVPDACGTRRSKTAACGRAGGGLGNVLVSLGVTGASCRS